MQGSVEVRSEFRATWRNYRPWLEGAKRATPLSNGRVPFPEGGAPTVQCAVCFLPCLSVLSVCLSVCTLNQPPPASRLSLADLFNSPPHHLTTLLPLLPSCPLLQPSPAARQRRFTTRASSYFLDLRSPSSSPSIAATPVRRKRAREWNDTRHFIQSADCISLYEPSLLTPASPPRPPPPSLLILLLLHQPTAPAPLSGAPAFGDGTRLTCVLPNRAIDRRNTTWSTSNKHPDRTRHG